MKPTSGRSRETGPSSMGVETIRDWSVIVSAVDRLLLPRSKELGTWLTMWRSSEGCSLFSRT